MGVDKLFVPFNNNKKEVSPNISNVRLVSTPKAFLVKISSDEIKSKRITAYRYLLP